MHVRTHMYTHTYRRLLLLHSLLRLPGQQISLVLNPPTEGGSCERTEAEIRPGGLETRKRKREKQGQRYSRERWNKWWSFKNCFWVVMKQQLLKSNMLMEEFRFWSIALCCHSVVMLFAHHYCSYSDSLWQHVQHKKVKEGETPV